MFRSDSDRRAFLGGASATASLLTQLLGSQGRAGATAEVSSVGGVSPMAFGAVGDGRSNDRAAILAAMAHAFGSGLPLDGGDRLYGVDDDIIVASRVRPWVSRLRLKNIAPAGDSQILYFQNCQQVRVDSLYIHTGDLADIGDRESRSGLRVEGGSGHRIRNVEATGRGKGRYVFVWRCRDSDFEDIYVHDGLFRDTSIHNNDPRVLVDDDVVEGIRIDDCSNCRLIRPRVRDLLGNATYYTASGFVPGNYSASEVKAYPNMRTRGISGGGNDGVSVIDPQVSNVDQGIDMSGSGGNWGNKKFNVIGGRTLNCASVGLKYGGQPSDCFVLGHTAENCGMFGFLVGGSTSHYKAQSMSLSSCVALNPGYNDIHNDAGDIGPNWIPNAHTGFLVFAQTDSGIEGVVLDNCQAIDRQGFYLQGDDAPWSPTGATGATMQFPWTGYTGRYQATFQTSAGPAMRTVMLTSGSTSVRWAGGLSGEISHPFVSMQRKMQYGFMAHNEAGRPIAFNQASRRPITLNDNCESVGHIVARAFGFHRDTCHLKAIAPQNIATGVAVSVQFAVEVDDSMDMHRASQEGSRIHPKRPGVYRVHGVATFEAAASGYRRIEIRKGAAGLHRFSVPAISFETTTCLFDVEIEFTVAEVTANADLSLWAFQNSGANINMTADRWLKVERVRQL